MTSLLAFHGYTLNGDVMRVQMGELDGSLARHVDIIYPDAPNECAMESVNRFYAAFRSRRLPPPHRMWWNASDDGQVYEGWEQTRNLVRGLIERHRPVGVLGFSQGATLAAAVAALSHEGELPSIRFAVLVAGHRPRAALLKPYFARPISCPSLHVWGEKDGLTGPYGQALAECFDAAEREVVVWPGTHVIPTKGSTADAIVDFVRRHATD